MTKRPIIFGAGLSGLIAARMMADRRPLVYEKQSELPNNHSAVLRFRSDDVSTATNIPFKQVNVLKSIRGYDDPIKDAVAYSLKVTGKIQPRSAMKLDPAKRYIAPPDFIQRLAVTADIKYDMDFLDWSSNLIRGDHAPVISTLPLPYMMDQFKWADKPDFASSSGWTMKAKIKPEHQADFYATVYNSLFSIGFNRWYRASVTGDEIMIEGVGELPTDENYMLMVNAACEHAFGITSDMIYSYSYSKAKYQKIVDLDFAGRESVKAFIVHLSRDRGIHSLGRFATWRPKLLLDDIVNDVRVINQLIGGDHA